MYKFFILLLGIALFVSSCKKDPSVLGLEVQPTGDRILNVRECVLPISAYTMSEDSITSDERTYNLLGSYKDPQFGYTSADFITQIRLAANNVSFNATRIRSITLFLAYSGSYRDLSAAQTPQHIKVFELKNEIKLSDTLYSNFAVYNYIDTSIILADFYFTPNINDTVLAITLDTVLADKILRASPDLLATADLFMQHFKGLYVQVDNNSPSLLGNILYFNLLSANTKLSIEYNDDQKYDMVINSSCARVNLFHHNYSGFPIYSSLDDTTIIHPFVYAQSMSGSRVKIKLPSFSTWQDSGIIVINKAELMLKVDETTIGEFAPPAKLFLVAADQNVKYSFLNDYLKNNKYFGGSYDATNISYKFNIPLQIQDLITGSLINKNLYLFPESNRTTGNRVVIQNNVANPIRLKLTYTKL